MKIVIIGNGKMATFLLHRWQVDESIEILGVCGRNFLKVQQWVGKGIKVFENIDAVKTVSADAIILAVSDDAISAYAEKLKGCNGVIIHCSGAFTNYDYLTHGCIWPVYSLADDNLPSFIPIAYLAHEERNRNVVKSLAEKLGSAFEITEKQKPVLHLGATIINNFIHHLLHITADILAQHDINKSLLMPILQQTTRQFLNDNLHHLQTGAAIRGDLNTMATHLELLKLNHQQKEIYKFLSESITNYNQDH